MAPLLPRVAAGVALGSALLLAACASTRSASGTTTVYVVRHAETESDGTNDPVLSDAGRQRAARLAERLAAANVVYATPYRRTQETAAAVAEQAGAEVIVVPIGDAGVDGYVADVTGRVRGLPPGTVAVVVGHSNTSPVVATALTGSPAPEIAHDAYDGLFIVTLSGDGAGTLEVATY